MNPDRTALWTRRIALGTLAVSVLWFAYAAIFGMGQIPSAGHIGAGHAGTTMMAERALRFHTPYPSWGWYQNTPPLPSDAYCHHPFGMYWVLMPFLAIFGHANFVPPLPAILMSIGSPLLLYAIGKRAWGPLAGASAALSFTVVPIAVGFANFQNLEVLCIFGMLVFFYGSALVEETGKLRGSVVSVIGILLTTAGDWVGFLGVSVVLGFYFVVRYILPRLLPHTARKPEGHRYWALGAAASVLSLVYWVMMFQRVDQLGEWLNSGGTRSAGNKIPLAAVLQERATWIDFSFTPFVILLGKITLPVVLLRLLVRRRLVETFAPAIWVAATVQYVAFKQGADVHIFWPHYFAAYFALAMGATTKTLYDVVLWIARKRRSVSLVWPLATALLVGVALPLFALPDAVRSLRIWRETGGRYNDRGHFVRTNQDLLYVIQDAMRPRAHDGFRTETHSSAQWGWEQDWALGHALSKNSSELATGDGSRAVWIARPSGLSMTDMKSLVSRAKVQSYGDDVWFVDRTDTTPGIVAMHKNEHDPNVFESLWYGSYVPVRSREARKDDFATWELGVHFGTNPPAPGGIDATGTDGSLESLRIRHNFAVQSGNAARAKELETAIRGRLLATRARTFQDGLMLMGTREHVDAEQRIELWFSVPPGYSKEFEMDVSSRVTLRNPTSFIPPDPTERPMFARALLPTKMWIPGFIYRWSFPALHRIGKEVYTASFRGPGAPTAERFAIAELE